MNTQPLGLPQAIPCPACSRPVAQVWAEPVFGEETGELEAVAVSCPHCGVRCDFDIETMAWAVALEAIERLHY